MEALEIVDGYESQNIDLQAELDVARVGAVMSCGVLSCAVMWCYVLCCVVWFDVLSCYVGCCHV